MTLLLVRHGESEGNVQGLIQGQLDLPLTEVGRAQGKAVAERLKSEGGADRIVASPLARAFETSQAIARALDLPVTTDDRLKEYDFGDEVSGLTIRQTIERFPGWRWTSERDPSYVSLPGEEGLPVLDARVAEVVAELFGFEGRTIVVTHGGVVTSALNFAVRMHGATEGGSPRVGFLMKNCAITELDRDPEGRLIVRRHNDACHLPAAS